MSYDLDDARRDEFYEYISRWLYPEHKAQAISEFTDDRLRSFYINNPQVMIPAVNVMREGISLRDKGHFAAALVFFCTGIELLLKATILKPVVYGLVHSAQLADVIVEHTFGQTGFDRYTKLLSKLYAELAKLDMNTITRPGAQKRLMEECKEVQALRNKIIHQGALCTAEESNTALDVVNAVYDSIVKPILKSLGLREQNDSIVALN